MWTTDPFKFSPSVQTPKAVNVALPDYYMPAWAGPYWGNDFGAAHLVVVTWA